MTRNPLRYILLFSVFVGLAQTSSPFAEDLTLTSESQSVQESQSGSLWKSVRDKLRFRTFTEFMTPAVSQGDLNVPDRDQPGLMPTNLFNIIWADYEIAKDTKIVYWQRLILFPAADGVHPGFQALPRNPRFAVRRVNLFNSSAVATTYDLYFQPGLAPEADAKGRNVETGFRTNTSYSVPTSRISLGMVTETTFSLSTQPEFEFAAHRSETSNFYGWLMPWASYNLTQALATQHYVTLNYQHNRGTSGLQWDYPLPYMQNGIGMDLTKQIWAAVFLNNYVGVTPTLSNSWASLWLSMVIL